MKNIKIYKIMMLNLKSNQSYDIAGMQNMKLLQAEHMIDCFKANHPDCIYQLINQATGKVEYEI